MRALATILLLSVAACLGKMPAKEDAAKCRSDAVTCWDACFGRYVSDVANADAARVNVACDRSCRSTCNSCVGEAESLTCEPFSM